MSWGFDISIGSCQHILFFLQEFIHRNRKHVIIYFSNTRGLMKFTHSPSWMYPEHDPFLSFVGDAFPRKI